MSGEAILVCLRRFERDFLFEKCGCKFLFLLRRCFRLRSRFNDFVFEGKLDRSEF
jgi:hypothetical protein